MLHQVLWTEEIHTDVLLGRMEKFCSELKQHEFGLCFWPQYYTIAEARKKPATYKVTASFLLFPKGVVWTGKEEKVMQEVSEKTASECKIVIMTNESTDFRACTRVFTLSSHLAVNLFDFFRHRDQHNSIDCSGFIEFLTKKKITVWRPIQEDQLQLGDIVFWLTTDEPLQLGTIRSYAHVALFLGDGCYLSKFGHGGPMVVTTLSDMYVCYRKSILYHGQ